MKKKFAIVPLSLIDDKRMDTAMHALATARKDLQLPMIRMCFFCEPEEALPKYGIEKPELFEAEYEPGEEIAGLFFRSKPTEIYIRASLEYSSLARTVAHEVWHFKEKLIDSGASIEVEEDSAHAYGELMRKREILNEFDEDAFYRHLCGEDFSKKSATATSIQAAAPKAESKAVFKADKELISKAITVSGSITKALGKADAEADIDLINQFALEPLKPEDVYCFSVALCDNDVDRDTERFTDRTLEGLAKLFTGKTGISDHDWSARRQIARLYRASVETTGKRNTLGEPLKQLIGSAYMVHTRATESLIDLISGGIMKEVSIGCAVGACNCSICKKPLRYDWQSGTIQCETGHIKGQKYNGRRCVGELEDPKDAFEFSFVAVPAQPGAGTVKEAIGDIPSFDKLPPEEQEYRRKLIVEMEEMRK